MAPSLGTKRHRFVWEQDPAPTQKMHCGDSAREIVIHSLLEAKKELRWKIRCVAEESGDNKSFTFSCYSSRVDNEALRRVVLQELNRQLCGVQSALQQEGIY